jgi:hypothetical protein
MIASFMFNQGETAWPNEAIKNSQVQMDNGHAFDQQFEVLCHASKSQ